MQYWFPYWWHVNTQIWWCFLIGWSKLSANQTYYYLDLVNESRSPVWNFCPHFPDVILQGNQCGLMKCCLFSQAVIRKGGNDYMNVFLTVSITSILPICTVESCPISTLVTRSPRYYGHFFSRAIHVHFLIKNPC